jgi:hypothetical protein
MNDFVQPAANGKTGFWGKRYNRRLLYLLVLGISALTDYLNLGLVRRTFVFYTLGEGTTVVEDRMFPVLPIQEIEIRRYVEEALLGPVSPETAPLFSRDTKLRSLLYRDGVVYVDLSEAAGLPPVEDAPLKDGEVYRSLYTLEEGIGRNFSAVKEVKLFINGYMIESSNPIP